MQFSCQAARFARLLTTTLALTSTVAVGYDLVPGDENSVNTITKQMAADMLSFYSGDKPGGTVGLLPQPYYWWEAGAMFDSLINYWVTTGDSQYNDLVSQGLLSQTGARNDYIPIEQTRVEGNDDQGFWGFAAMSAAEYGLPNPPSGKPQWLALAQAVFNSQVPRWDDKTCGGGLRWQIFTFNSGIDYKNSISQATFFGLGARLALYTGNKTYGDWADKTWNWMRQVDLIDDRGYIYDGINANNCTNRTPYQFTYNTGGIALGAAAMYNFTSDQKWLERLQLVIKGADVFFTNYDNIMTEVACETADRCNLDQQSFKAYMSRWFAVGAQWAPPIFDTVEPWLKTSSVAAAKQCSGGDNGKMCGLKWSSGKYDGTTGVGQQMAAMEVALSTRLQNRRAPYRADNGGTSVGDVNAGTSSNADGEPLVYGPLPAGSAAGGAFVTLALLLGWFYAIAWILKDERSSISLFKQAKFAATDRRGAMGAAAGFKMRGAEKSKADVAENGSNSSRTPDRNSNISDRDIALDAPIRIGHVRNASDVTVRRMSNMPLGWPRNSMANFPNNSETLSQRGSMFIGGTTSDAGSPRINNLGAANLTPSASHGSVGMPPLSLHNSPQAHSSPVGMATSEENDALVPRSPIH